MRCTIYPPKSLLQHHREPDVETIAAAGREQRPHDDCERGHVARTFPHKASTNCQIMPQTGSGAVGKQPNSSASFEIDCMVVQKKKNKTFYRVHHTSCRTTLTPQSRPRICTLGPSTQTFTACYYLRPFIRSPSSCVPIATKHLCTMFCIRSVRFDST